MLQRLNTRPQARTNVQPRPTRQNTKQTQFSGLYKIRIKNEQGAFMTNIQTILSILKNDDTIKKIINIIESGGNGFFKQSIKKQSKSKEKKIIAPIIEKDNFIIGMITEKEKTLFLKFKKNSKNKNNEFSTNFVNFFEEQEKQGTPIQKTIIKLKDLK